MKTSPFLYLLCLALLLPIMSCGQSGEKEESAGSDEVVAEGLTPEELAEAIMATYREAVGDIVTLTEGLPDGQSIYDDAVSMKEQYVQKFVAYGKQKEAMSDADRSAIDRKLRLGMSSFYRDQAYKAYMEATNSYMSTHRELQKILADFNVITQYADFELLRKQLPEEAKRFGV
ncbi:MAG: hypothetical protein C0600_02855 [Ignavibacteria bacterium]|nr:MAG: hypothetical protein C0600_02855 [Ignavibacteria bacterium]